MIYFRVAWWGCTRQWNYIPLKKSGLLLRRMLVQLSRVICASSLCGDRLGSDVKSGVTNALYAYLAAEREAEEGGSVDLDAVRISVEASRETMFGALVLLAASRSKDSELPPGYDAPLPEREFIEPPPVSTKIERAVAMLPPKQQQYTERLFGLVPDQPTFTVEEISASEGIGRESVRSSLQLAYRDLRIILASFEEHGADFAAWPEKRFLKNYNVLTYLYRVGQEIPLDRSVGELRMLAQQDLAGRDGRARDKQIVAELYGLYNEKKTAMELGEHYCCSRATILQAVTKVIGARPAGS